MKQKVDILVPNFHVPLKLLVPLHQLAPLKQVVPLRQLVPLHHGVQQLAARVGRDGDVRDAGDHVRLRAVVQLQLALQGVQRVPARRRRDGVFSFLIPPNQFNGFISVSNASFCSSLIRHSTKRNTWLVKLLCFLFQPSVRFCTEHRKI
jgi:hypothetical protein